MPFSAGENSHVGHGNDPVGNWACIVLDGLVYKKAYTVSVCVHVSTVVENVSFLDRMFSKVLLSDFTQSHKCSNFSLLYVDTDPKTEQEGVPQERGMVARGTALAAPNTRSKSPCTI